MVFLLSDSSMAGLVGGLFVLVIILIVALLIPAILYLISLQNTLNAVSPANRKTQPGNVWLMLIPVFNIVWNFLLVGYIADSLKAEFASRNQPVAEVRPGYTIGLWMCILNCCSFIPVVNIFTGIGSLVCWIIYWVKIVEYKNMLLTGSNNPSLDNVQQ